MACTWFQLLKVLVLFPSIFLGMQGAGSPPEGLFYKRPWRLRHFLAVTLGPGLSGLLTRGDIGSDGSLKASRGGGSCRIIELDRCPRQCLTVTLMGSTIFLLSRSADM